MEDLYEYEDLNCSQDSDLEYLNSQDGLKSESTDDSLTTICTKSKADLYVVLSRQQLKDYIYNKIKEIVNEYGFSENIALKLLMTGGWKLNRVQTQEKIFDEYVLDCPTQRILKPKNNSSQFECFLCKGSGLMEGACSVGCEHFSCLECFLSYLISAIIQKEFFRGCYCDGCPESITLSVYEKYLANSSEYKGYEDSVLDEIKKTIPSLIDCPRQDCDSVIKFTKILKGTDPPITVKCDCDYKFCSQCGNKAHAPADCQEYIQRMNIVAANANRYEDIADLLYKPCPNCSLLVEKVTKNKNTYCEACNFQFCWDCLADWETGCFEDCTSGTEEILFEYRQFEIQKEHYLDCEKIHNFRFQIGKTIIKNFKELNAEVSHPQSDGFLREAIELNIDVRRMIMMQNVARNISGSNMGLIAFSNEAQENAIAGALKLLENCLESMLDIDEMKKLFLVTIQETCQFGRNLEEYKDKLIEITKCLKVITSHLFAVTHKI